MNISRSTPKAPADEKFENDSADQIDDNTSSQKRPNEDDANVEKERKKPRLPSLELIPKMTVAQLKEELEELGIEPKKLKADLIAQLQHYVSEHTKEEPATEKSNSNNNNDSGKMKNSFPSTEKIQKMTVTQLKAELAKVSLSLGE